MTQLSPLSAVTDQLERIVAEHGFTAITIGLNIKQAVASRYDCAIHFDDGKPGVIGCVHGHGANIGVAINNAYRETLTKRLHASVSIVSEAA